MDDVFCVRIRVQVRPQVRLLSETHSLSVSSRAGAIQEKPGAHVPVALSTAAITSSTEIIFMHSVSYGHGGT